MFPASNINLPSVFFSDLHATADQTDRMATLEKFLRSEIVFGAQQIFLLGDIFDLMIGQHDCYFKDYQRYFDLLAEHIKRGATVYYFQGNHDFHLRKLYDKFLKKYNLAKNFHLIDGPALFTFKDKTLYISHGDELDINNHAYQRYKRIIRSPLARFLAERVVSEALLKKIGAYLADKSKNHQKNFNWEKSFVDYRSYIQKLWDRGIHGVVVGHSHVCDAWEEGVHFYYNVGFAPQEKQFLYWGEEGLQFVPLE